ncbi:Hypothetical protein, putative [Bodo saltans]|uniref:Uncharacterized protein n=1 Tax=Bodo saltans TaxID=75058 RepID=A0A0S4JPZ8_BODSA|nr:Hypothetical protein, putative [Bodo saltans]|eukprot:CUG92326.1 Hypothetical protein, putative [Bodo saltans]
MSATFDPVSYTLSEILREHDAFSRKISDRVHVAAASVSAERSSSPSTHHQYKGATVSTSAAARHGMSLSADLNAPSVVVAGGGHHATRYQHTNPLPTFRDFVDTTVVPLGRRPPALPW